MKISELIKQLEKQMADVGDVPVEVRNPAGDWATPDAVEKVNLSRKRGKTDWGVFIDA